MYLCHEKGQILFFKSHYFILNGSLTMQVSPDKTEYASVLALSFLVPGVWISALGGRLPAALPGAAWR